MNRQEVMIEKRHPCKALTVALSGRGLGGTLKGLARRRARQVHAVDSVRSNIPRGELVVDFAEPYANSRVEGAELISLEGKRATYRFERGTISASELIQRLSQRYRIRDHKVREPEIEATVRQICEERLLEQRGVPSTVRLRD